MTDDVQRSHMEGKPAAFVAAADVVLQVHRRRFLAHTQLLSAESPVLAELLAVHAGAPPKAGELPVVALAESKDSDALGTRTERRVRTFAALLDAVYNPAKRMAASWDLPELESLASMAHVLQMDALLFLCDEVCARELAKLLLYASAASWGPTRGKRGGISSAASAIHGADTKWCLLGETYGLPRTTSVALRVALKKVTRVEWDPYVDAAIVRDFIKSLGAPIRDVILDEMVAVAVHPRNDPSIMRSRLDDALASTDELAVRLRDAMGLGARQTPSWA